MVDSPLYHDSKLFSDKCHTLSSASQNHLKQNFAVDAKSQWITPKQQRSAVSKRYTSLTGSDCNIRQLKSHEVAKCLTQKKILFFGDSMSRDFGMSLVFFLNQKNSQPSDKNAMIGKHIKVAEYARDTLCVCWSVRHERDIDHIFGKLEANKMYLQNKKKCVLTFSYASKSSERWRVDIAHEGSYNSPLTWPKVEAMQTLFSYDLIILGNHGFHNLKNNIATYSEMFMHPLLKYSNSLVIDHNETLADDMLAENQVQKLHTMPYLYLFANTNYDDLKGPLARKFRQSYLVEYINAVSRDFLETHSLPYFDNLFVTDYKETSVDGVHLHRWANLIQVQLLMHFSCTKELEFKNHSIFAL